ncbi:hypothetical protein MJ561_13415 [Klebsiella pneumoniae]|nr:hypothetical protein MJ561_13415 [Klebsiella pneumoniae]
MLLASVQQFLDRQHGLARRRPRAAQSENRLTVWDPATGQAIATTADASRLAGCRPGGDVRLARFVDRCRPGVPGRP